MGALASLTLKFEGTYRRCRTEGKISKTQHLAFRMLKKKICISWLFSINGPLTTDRIDTVFSLNNRPKRAETAPG